MQGGRASDAAVLARRERVLESVLATGGRGIAELAHDFSVSKMTMHRDLDALEDAGYLRKVRGRAEAPSELTVETSAVFRLRAATEVKDAVARGALDLVEGARTVFVDDSTSALPLLRALAARAGEPLTVVTNYLQVLREVAAAPHVRVQLLGGAYEPHLDATFGPDAVEALRRTQVDVTVVSSPAVHRGVCYHALEPSAELKQAALEVADRSVVLLDHSKLGRTAPYTFGPVPTGTHVVVDDSAAPAEVDALRAAGADVRVVRATG